MAGDVSGHEAPRVLAELLPHFLPLLAPVTLLLVTAVSRFQAGRWPIAVERSLAVATGVGVVASLASAFLLAARAVSPEASGIDALVRLDGLGVTMLVMVSVLVAAIGRFSSTYLEGDGRHGAFLGRLAATAASVQVLVLANDLVVFWLAWVATSVCLHQLLLFYPERPRAQIAARKKFLVARLGDLFLGVAFLLLWWHFETTSLTALFTALSSAAGSALLTACAVLLVLTALLKSAQFPTHGWLVEVMEAPTPVSALLHAGVLNAGPFLILRFAPVVELALVSQWLLIAVGGCTALFASVVLLTQPSVKVALGYSSAAHMGFSLFVCGIGVYPAAALHLVAHSFYKAHAFLSSGSTVEATKSARIELPRPTRSPLALALGMVGALSTYAAVGALLGVTPGDDPALLLVGCVLMLGLTQFLATGLDPRAGFRVHARVIAAAAAVTATFFALEALACFALAGSIPARASTSLARLAPGVAIIVAGLLVIAAQQLGRERLPPQLEQLRIHLRHGLYLNAYFDRLVRAFPARTMPRGSSR